MHDIEALTFLAEAMGVHTRYRDGLKRPVTVAPETLLRVCAALGAPIARPGDAASALLAFQATTEAGSLPPVLVAWDGALPPVSISEFGTSPAELLLEDGDVAPLEIHGRELRTTRLLPLGYHGLKVGGVRETETCTVIAAPMQAWRRPDARHSWGVSTHLAALRSARSRSLGDLRDLESVCRWVGDRGGDLVMVLPLLPTFNSKPDEPSPYSPVSRLFWSELVLDLGDAHRPSDPSVTLDVTRADAEVRAALAGLPMPEPALLDDELVRYARFRGAQARLGRNWRDWPSRARAGTLEPDHIDPEEECFQLVAQTRVRRQLDGLRQRLDDDGIRLGLDLAVGVHPDGYDPWSRQTLFAEGMSVGAPPDEGFPSGQDWGFPPVLPEASRGEGHRYLAASIALQAKLSGVLRVDHIMALTRLYWIPHGLGLHEGTYVSYPPEELFAILTLESHRNRCEVVGENLGTVPPAINEALPRHRIWGMYLAQFEAADPGVEAATVSDDPSSAADFGSKTAAETRPPTAADIQVPTATDMALINTHDTPTFAGWLASVDIEERVRCGLLEEKAAPRARDERTDAAQRLAERLDCSVDDPRAFLAELLEWLGGSDSPLVVAWFEDLWLEDQGVNVPGTRSSERPNWQRPMRRLLDEIFTDPEVERLIRRLHQARNPE
jgi:4-alpha-glucanotransferase